MDEYKLSVFAVDDSRTMRNILKITLTECGMDVALADNGQSGLDALEGQAPDVIITDINMPVLDGFGFIEGVRRMDSLKATPILVLTTESAPEMRARARKAGATGWIVKPFDRDNLISAIRRVTA